MNKKDCLRIILIFVIILVVLGMLVPFMGQLWK